VRVKRPGRPLATLRVDATRRRWLGLPVRSAASTRMAHVRPFASRCRGRKPKNATRFRRCACLTREVAPIVTVHFEGDVWCITFSEPLAPCVGLRRTSPGRGCEAREEASQGAARRACRSPLTSLITAPRRTAVARCSNTLQPHTAVHRRASRMGLLYGARCRRQRRRAERTCRVLLPDLLANTNKAHPRKDKSLPGLFTVAAARLLPYVTCSERWRASDAGRSWGQSARGISVLSQPSSTLHRRTTRRLNVR